MSLSSSPALGERTIQESMWPLGSNMSLIAIGEHGSQCVAHRPKQIHAIGGPCGVLFREYYLMSHVLIASARGLFAACRRPSEAGRKSQRGGPALSPPTESQSARGSGRLEHGSTGCVAHRLAPHLSNNTRTSGEALRGGLPHRGATRNHANAPNARLKVRRLADGTDPKYWIFLDVPAT